MWTETRCHQKCWKRHWFRLWSAHHVCTKEARKTPVLYTWALVIYWQRWTWTLVHHCQSSVINVRKGSCFHFRSPGKSSKIVYRGMYRGMYFLSHIQGRWTKETPFCGGERKGSLPLRKRHFKYIQLQNTESVLSMKNISKHKRLKWTLFNQEN